jgi:hypothetical protein
MIAFTNHALDHLLSAVLDAGITNSVVRLGSRSADECIAEYSLEKQEAVAGKSRLDRAFARNHRELKAVEEELQETMERFLKVEVDSNQIIGHLEVHHPEEHEYLAINPPAWIVPLYRNSIRDDGTGEWQQAGPRGRAVLVDRTMYAFWRRGGDLEFLEPPAPVLRDQHVMEQQEMRDNHSVTQNQYAALASQVEAEDISGSNSEAGLEDDDSDEDDSDGPMRQKWMKYVPAPRGEPPRSANVEPELDPVGSNNRLPSPPPPSPPPEDSELRITDLQDPKEYFLAFGLEAIPSIPCSNRSLEELNIDADPWSCSMLERERLHNAWKTEVKENLAASEQETFETLRARHAEVLARYNEGKNEVSISYFSAKWAFLDLLHFILGSSSALEECRNHWGNYHWCKQTYSITEGEKSCVTKCFDDAKNAFQGLGPRVMLVEEAGQVLEAHILASLVPSVEHLICIGDPLQLRPTLNNYGVPSHVHTH